jgi:hypothetical protein
LLTNWISLFIKPFEKQKELIGEPLVVGKEREKKGSEGANPDSQQNKRAVKKLILKNFVTWHTPILNPG